MRKFLGELKLAKGLGGDDIPNILREKGYIVVMAQETEINKLYNILDNEEMEEHSVYINHMPYLS